MYSNYHLLVLILNATENHLQINNVNTQTNTNMSIVLFVCLILFLFLCLLACFFYEILNKPHQTKINDSILSSFLCVSKIFRPLLQLWVKHFVHGSKCRSKFEPGIFCLRAKSLHHYTTMLLNKKMSSVF